MPSFCMFNWIIINVCCVLREKERKIGFKYQSGKRKTLLELLLRQLAQKNPPLLKS